MSNIMKIAVLVLYLFAVGVVTISATRKIYFEDNFSDGAEWESRWVQSEHKSDLGKFILDKGKFYGDAEASQGLKTSEDARFYGLSAKFDTFSNEDDTLVIQFSVKHEQNIDCGGGYIKLFPSSVNQKDLHGESPYNIMFGPDICGPGTKKVHVIFTYKGKNLLTKKEIKCKDDEFTHLYTLILRPDNTYEVKIDNVKVESGSLEEDWDFLAPKQIKDPEAKKPSDWDDRAKIDDPEDKKPEDWEKPEHIPDPEAKKPEDWDDEMDGEWEPPQIDNPEYKGEWKPKQIDNPDFKGEWVHPMIDNPEYSEDQSLYKYVDNSVLGLDLWQVKSGTIFDSFLMTNCVEYAEEQGKAKCVDIQEAEKKMKDAQDEEERKKAEAEAKDAKPEEAGEDDDEDEEDIEPPTTEAPSEPEPEAEDQHDEL